MGAVRVSSSFLEDMVLTMHPGVAVDVPEMNVDHGAV